MFMRWVIYALVSVVVVIAAISLMQLHMPHGSVIIMAMHSMPYSMVLLSPRYALSAPWATHT
ncbi:hypothetical protein [Vulcanisaeta souniana]|nr:hypothetical protein [Vulcanisaeta souniana]